MSITCSGESFQLKWMDSARFVKEEGLGFKKAFIAFFKGKTITNAEYLNLRKGSQTHSPKTLQHFYEAKKVYNRTINKEISISPDDKVSGTNQNDPEVDAEMNALLNSSRTNENEVSDEVFELREKQERLFQLIKTRFQESGLKLSIFDNKESREVMRELEASNLFDYQELSEIRKHLANELDSSPYWK
ncbi:hypothetical protein [Endozoicomonas elysicola]|uniref:Uncharacterized protein n=1 Tax=Endozoicomonas elysicola TaxID=305900 RepID=A0A081K7N5_9GAMM|nr:hypothetical protein [Endozoicomonas elysicola]KEI70161.1 hypothetical protein GV64_04850 [Endozoicomonas elysicola]